MTTDKATQTAWNIILIFIGIVVAIAYNSGLAYLYHQNFGRAEAHGVSVVFTRDSLFAFAINLVALVFILLIMKKWPKKRVIPICYGMLVVCVSIVMILGLCGAAGEWRL